MRSFQPTPPSRRKLEKAIGWMILVLDPVARRVLASLLTTPPAGGFRAHPQLRFLGQPQAGHTPACLFSVARFETRIAGRTTRLRHSRRSRFLALPNMRWTDEGHRKAQRCRNPTSFSTAADGCGMTRLARTRIPCVLRHPPNFCALLPNRSLLPPSSTTLFELLFRRSQVMGAWPHVLALRGTVLAHLGTAPPYN